jgi:hypothetical protein
VQFYEGTACNTPTGSVVNLSSAVTATQVFVGVDEEDYSYRVTSLDQAGNTTVSACSPAMHITTVIAPSGLSYSSSTATYVYNADNTAFTDNIAVNTPSVTGTVTSYSISPNFTTNTGLTFNTSTGVISGKPTTTSAETSYTVTASNAGGSATTTLLIRTGPGFLVNSSNDSGSGVIDNAPGDRICATITSTCTLRAAIQEVNALSDNPTRLIVVPAYTITTGSTLSLTNNVEIIGAGIDSTVISGGSGAYDMITTSGGSTGSNYGPPARQ